MADGTWVLVSDACRARLFQDLGPRGGLEELEAFNRPQAREHVKDRVSDRTGLKPAGGQGARVGASQEVDPKEAEGRAFARLLADMLQKRWNRQAFSGLVLIAPPHFLGLLRNALSETVAKCVVASIDKDLTVLGAPELSRRLHVQVR